MAFGTSRHRAWILGQRPLGCRLGPLGRHLGGLLETVLRHLRSLSGASWGPSGGLLGHLGGFLRLLGASRPPAGGPGGSSWGGGLEMPVRVCPLRPLLDALVGVLVSRAVLGLKGKPPRKPKSPQAPSPCRRAVRGRERTSTVLWPRCTGPVRSQPLAASDVERGGGGGWRGRADGNGEDKAKSWKVPAKHPAEVAG